MMDEAKMQNRLGDVQAGCDDLMHEVSRLRAVIEKQGKVVEAAIYFILNNRSWMGANQLEDAVVMYHSE